MQFDSVYPAGAVNRNASAPNMNTVPNISASGSYNVGGAGAVSASALGASMWIVVGVIGALLLLHTRLRA